MNNRNRYEKFLDELNGDMKRRGIKKVDVWKTLGMSNATLINFLNGKSVSMDTMKKVIDFIDNPKNWKK